MSAIPAASGFDSSAFRRALGCFPTGVAVVTANSNGRPVGLTVNSFSSVSLDPPLVLWSLRSDSPSRDAIVAANHFVVNVLSREQGPIALRFARPAEDKFAGLQSVLNRWGAPCLSDCSARFECEIEQVHEAGDHVIFIGRVTEFQTMGLKPLIFSEGALQAL
jgi:flavin reductase (DIM6/NTAB) family NADH-FMN oxidoreductase RutF